LIRISLNIYVYEQNGKWQRMEISFDFFFKNQTLNRMMIVITKTTLNYKQLLIS